ncbi:MAG: proton-conducting membrane transporter [Phyllobacteriaceae bacterium]|nr:proton-conducting membrane transporter [Phyllobacteriaceae bacterium]
MFLYMLAAFLLGLFLGWLIWGRLRGELDGLRAERDRLKGDLDSCGRARGDLERRLRDAEANAANERARLTAEIEAATKAKVETKPAAAPKTAVAAAPAALMAAPAKKVPAVVAKSKAPPKPAAPEAAAAKPASNMATVPAKPAAPSRWRRNPLRPGPPRRSSRLAPDDLRLILGIGKTNEKKLHAAGVTTFKQIAAWTSADVKRIGDVINFGERIVKEKWIDQAALLAKGDMDAFFKAFPAAKGDGNS